MYILYYIISYSLYKGAQAECRQGLGQVHLQGVVPRRQRRRAGVRRGGLPICIYIYIYIYIHICICMYVCI